MDDSLLLQDQIASILGSRDAVLDSATFDSISSINQLFPTEQSFAQSDRILIQLSRRIQLMERELRDLLHLQTEECAAVVGQNQRQELHKINELISGLFQRIQEVGSKAQHAELTVQSITKDIKMLDCAKRNLVSTITVVRRLQMLTSAVEQLREVVKSRDSFTNVAHSVQVVIEMSHQFSSFTAVPQINQLLETVKTMMLELKRNLLFAFEAAFSQQGNLVGGRAPLVRDICLVIVVMEPELKTQVLEWYIDLQLGEYRSIFRPEDEVGNLDNIGRRFAYLKRICKNYDDEQANVFPKDWNVSQLVCKRFCAYTKEHLVSFLSTNRSSIDVKALISGLQATLEFEQGLNRRFSSIQENAESESGAAIEVPHLFNGDVSSAFEPFMYIYIDAEDKNLAEMMEKFKQKNTLAEDDLNTGVLTASTDLFFFYKQTLLNLSKLNDGKPLVDLGKLFGKWLITLCDLLTAKLPKEEKKNLGAEELKYTCIILNTAEYCYNITGQLEEKISEKVNPAMKAMIEMTKEKEIFLVLITNAIQSLVKQVSGQLAPALQSMTKISWSSMKSVGDQSEYVTILSNTLSKHVKDIRKLITTQKHFKWFCDKFVDHFVPVFVKNIYSCKPLSEAGAEQMLLDAHAIKTALLELPNIGAEERHPPSAVFTKFVVKGMIKAETLLKIVLTPLDPPELIIKNYMILTAEQQNTSGAVDTDSTNTSQKPAIWTPQKVNELRDGFTKILELKGVKKHEQQNLIDQLMKRLPQSGRTLPSLTSATSTLSPASFNETPVSLPNQSPAADSSSSATGGNNLMKPLNISDAGAKLNENFKRFAAAIDIKTNWMKRESNNS